MDVQTLAREVCKGLEKAGGIINLILNMACHINILIQFLVNAKLFQVPETLPEEVLGKMGITLIYI